MDDVLRRETRVVDDLAWKLRIPLGSGASWGEILLAYMKDEMVQKMMYQMVYEGLQGLVIPTHALAMYEPELEGLIRGCYYGITTASGLQTLGEEYCDITPMHKQSIQLTEGKAVRQPTDVARVISIPTPMTPRTRALWLIFHVFAPYVYNRSRVGWEKLLVDTTVLHLGQAASTNHNISERDDTMRHVLRKKLKSLDRIISIFKSYGKKIEELLPAQSGLTMIQLGSALASMHLCLFYFSSRYYEFSKRCFGIRYMLTYHKRKESQGSLSLLGYLIVAKLGISTFHGLYNMAQVQSKHRYFHGGESPEKVVDNRVPSSQVVSIDDEEVEATIRFTQKKKCILCLDDRRDPTITKCGHVYCWTCIVTWCQNKPECPLCRQESIPQSLRRIYNYN